MATSQIITNRPSLVAAIRHYVGKDTQEFIDSIDSYIALAENRIRNIRVPLMKSDPENNASFRFQANAEGMVNIPLDMAQPILFYTREPLIQYSQQGIKETQIDNYLYRYGLYPASGTGISTYDGTFAEFGSQYLLSPRPEVGTEVYMYYYRQVPVLGPDGGVVDFSGTATANGNLTVVGQTFSVSANDSASQVATNFAASYNVNDDLVGTANVDDNDATVVNIDTRTDIVAAGPTTDNGITVSVVQTVIDENFLLSQAPDLYLYACLAEAFGAIRNEAQRDYYNAKFQDAYESIQEANSRAEQYGGRRLKRSKYSPRRTSVYSQSK